MACDNCGSSINLHQQCEKCYIDSHDQFFKNFIAEHKGLLISERGYDIIAHNFVVAFSLRIGEGKSNIPYYRLWQHFSTYEIPRPVLDWNKLNTNVCPPYLYFKCLTTLCSWLEKSIMLQR